MVDEVITAVRAAYPNITIFLWTGYVLEALLYKGNTKIAHILNNIDILIDGPFIEEEKDLDLHLRGSRNQRIFQKVNEKWEQITENDIS